MGGGGEEEEKGWEGGRVVREERKEARMPVSKKHHGCMQIRVSFCTLQHFIGYTHKL